MDTFYPWAAGFLDGEGTISVKRFHRIRKDGSKYIYYQPFISASQAVVGGHEKAIEKLKTLFGGSICRWENRLPRYPTVQWSVVSLDALKCLDKIYPHLVIKRKNADVLREFFSNRVKSSGGSGKITITDKEQKWRESMFFKSRMLNQKGKLYLQRLNEDTL